MIDENVYNYLDMVSFEAQKIKVLAKMIDDNYFDAMNDECAAAFSILQDMTVKLEKMIDNITHKAIHS